MEKTTIYILRHGQSEGNAKGIYLGRTDWDITDIGRVQAQYAADYLKDVEFDAIYSSPLKRAHNTALPHALIRNTEVIDCEDFAEIFIGKWEGMYTRDIKNEYHDEYFDGWTDNYFTFTCPEGESVAGGGERFKNGLLRVANAHQGKTILVASHAGVIRAFWGTLFDLDPSVASKEILFPSNASYSIVSYENGSFTPVLFSCDDHIPKEEKTFIS